MSAHDKVSKVATTGPVVSQDDDLVSDQSKTIRRPGPDGAVRGAAAQKDAKIASAASGQDDLRAERQRRMAASGPAPAKAAAATDPEAAARRANQVRIRALRAAERPERPQKPVRPAAAKARIQRRHIALMLSFVFITILPIGASAWYLYARAADQYASYLGFSVRGESGPTATDLLGGIGSMLGATSSSGSDTDILYKFIQSRDLIEAVNKRVDLRAIWSKPENDPIFSYHGSSAPEELLGAWEKKVRIYYDNGMLDLRVLAFDPVDARNVAQAIYDEGTILINQLNDIAREDGLRYSRDELDRAETRLKQARAQITAFRSLHQMVDPTADVARQLGVVSTLEEQLARELVDSGMLRANARPGDQRIAQSDLRINVIRDQIQSERQKFGSESATGEALSEIVGRYEGLAVDREFAERTYTATLAAYDTARAEAARQSRYLAAYVKPTIAREPEFPERAKLLIMIGGFLLVMWMVMVLVFYSLRDRR